MNASIVDLRYRMKDVLRAVERGETVTVLYRGKATATLAPYSSQPGSAKTADQPFFGMWSDRRDLADPAAHVRSLRRPRHAPPTGVKKLPLK